MKKNSRYITRLQRGFTLLELLLAVSLTAIIGIGLYRTLYNGVAVWGWIQTHQMQNDAIILFERLSNDLNNYCPIPDEVSFRGDGSSMSFMVHASEYLNDEYTDNTDEEGLLIETSLYQVTYMFDRKRHVIRRSIIPFGSRQLAGVSTLVHNVSAVSFSYVEPDDPDYLKETAVNLLSTIKECPQAVKVEFFLRNEDEGQQTVRRMITVPYGLFSWRR